MRPIKKKNLQNGMKSVKCYHYNNRVKGEMIYNQEGQKSEKEIWYYDNGQVRLETPFKNGLEHGVEKKFYKNGVREYELTYKNGVKHGLIRRWDIDGTEEDRTYAIEGKEYTYDELKAISCHLPGCDSIDSLFKVSQHREKLGEANQSKVDIIATHWGEAVAPKSVVLLDHKTR